MTTFHDDYIRLRFDGGDRDFLCKRLGLDWPPPKEIEVFGIPMRLVNMSKTSDRQRMISGEVRCAIYEPDRRVAE
jgi:hypothetical protein